MSNEKDPINQQVVHLMELAADLADSIQLDLADGGEISEETVETLQEFQELFNELNSELDGKIGIQ